jgi:hypothetical protein
MDSIAKPALRALTAMAVELVVRWKQRDFGPVLDPLQRAVWWGFSPTGFVLVNLTRQYPAYTISD